MVRSYFRAHHDSGRLLTINADGEATSTSSSSDSDTEDHTDGDDNAPRGGGGRGRGQRGVGRRGGGGGPRNYGNRDTYRNNHQAPPDVENEAEFPTLG